jgi:hypothetical protein
MKKSPAENVMRAENEASALPERSPFYDTTSATLPDLEPSFRAEPTWSRADKQKRGPLAGASLALVNAEGWLTLNVSQP